MLDNINITNILFLDIEPVPQHPQVPGFVQQHFTALFFCSLPLRGMATSVFVLSGHATSGRMLEH